MIGKRFSLKRYLTLTRAGIIEGLSFRSSYLVTLVGNIVYLIFVYFLWRAIYASSPNEVVNGMSFNDTMIYLVLATALFSLMEVWLVWEIGRDIQSGKIILNMLKPIDFEVYMFFQCSGGIVTSFIITFLPTFVVVYFITKGSIALGVNIIFFIISVVIAIMINFSIDFFISTVCLYTESPWGINIMKEVVVLLLSGATVPLAFFPDTLRKIVTYMPFQAIYNTPLQILIGKNLDMADYGKMILVQFVWSVIMIIISRLFWSVSKKVITVNGG